MPDVTKYGLRVQEEVLRLNISVDYAVVVAVL